MNKYIPFVLCWVLFVLAIGISLSWGEMWQSNRGESA